MRIVGGALKGRRLEAPSGAHVRPTSDRARESLFNRLMHGSHGPGGVSPVPAAVVVDAFCGTGALGLEALSRGAASATFVDRDRQVLAVARANAAALGVEDTCRFVAADATRPPAAAAPATLLFLDPPYDSGLALPALEALADRGWMAAGAVICLEVAADDPLAAPAGFVDLDSRVTGAARIMLLRYGDA